MILTEKIRINDLIQAAARAFWMPGIHYFILLCNQGVKKKILGIMPPILSRPREELVYRYLTLDILHHYVQNSLSDVTLFHLCYEVHNMKYMIIIWNAWYLNISYLFLCFLINGHFPQFSPCPRPFLKLWSWDYDVNLQFWLSDLSLVTSCKGL